jgi:DNA-binding NtrC family response regulator
MNPASRKTVRVLVVDDEISLLRALEALLEGKGYEVVALESPIAATQRLAIEDFDVALLDVKMPELSGIELLSAVKHRRPEIEVLMMTDHTTVETAVAAIEAGAYDYVTKPFDDGELVARAVAKAAERKTLLDRNRELEHRVRERDGQLRKAGDDGAFLSMSYAAAKEQSLRRFEKGYVDALMRACNNNISAAARKAGMDRSNFKRVLRKYRQDVEPDTDEPGGGANEPHRLAG